MALVLAANALIDVTTVLGDLGLVSDPAGSPVTFRINSASAAIENHCNRQLTWAARVETYGTPGAPRPARLQLQTPPIWPPVNASVIQVQLDLDPGIFQNAAVVLTAGQDFYLEDSSRGWLFRQIRWPSTALRRPDIVQDWDPDQVELNTQVKYLGGYVTPVQVAAAVVWPTGTTPALCTLVQPASRTTQIWGCTTSGAVGGSEPSWPASPAQFATLTDGAAAWTFLGYNGTVATQPQAATLPQDIQQAALETVTTWYRRRGQQLDITAEKFGDSSQNFGTTRTGLPSTAVELLANYRFIVMG